MSYTSVLRADCRSHFSLRLSDTGRIAVEIVGTKPYPIGNNAEALARYFTRCVEGLDTEGPTEQERYLRAFHIGEHVSKGGKGYPNAAMAVMHFLEEFPTPTRVELQAVLRSFIPTAV